MSGPRTGRRWLLGAALGACLPAGAVLAQVIAGRVFFGWALLAVAAAEFAGCAFGTGCLARYLTIRSCRQEIRLLRSGSLPEDEVQ
jgi:hypothetical protein